MEKFRDYLREKKNEVAPPKSKASLDATMVCHIRRWIADNYNSIFFKFFLNI